MEIFRSALASMPGLQKLGIVIFRWAALVSAHRDCFVHVVCASQSAHDLPDIAIPLMRSVSLLELCLLGFLCVSMNALRLVVRDRAFGFALGFGIMASNDFISPSLSYPVSVR
jgi:hypothetical protein